MKGRSVYPVLVFSTIFALVLVSCGSTPQNTGTATATSTPPMTSTSTVTKPTAAASGPQYGGTLVTALTADYTSFDPTKTQAIRVGHMQLTSNELMQGDWKKGPAGTKQTDWEIGFLGLIELETGELAESWETPDNETIIFRIRKGAKFQNKPPANGREVTAQDVVWNINYQFTYPGVWQAVAYPPSSGLAPTSVKAIDKSTVEIKVPSKSLGIMLLEIGDNLYTNPPEVWTSGGDMTDWRKVIGSGPWILTDYVPASSITYTRNPNYMEFDPVRPDNRLPYAETFKELVIPDVSTRLAALRTGKIDYLMNLVPDDARDLLKTYPDLKSYKRIPSPWYAAMRIDKPPFSDIKVRKAMNLAVDKKAVLNDYWDGDGVLLGYPYTPAKTYEKYYTPLEQMPAEVQELFTYSVDKAKLLLKEAGYPNGFKTTIIAQPAYSDEVSIIKEYLSKIGIDMAIDLKEPGVWTSIRQQRQQQEMIYAPCLIHAPYELLMTKKGMVENVAFIDDPYFQKVQEVVARDVTSNPSNYVKTVKDAGVYELGLAWAIWMPAPYQYNLWWPWVNNYYGVSSTGWAGGKDWTKFIWVDQELKKAKGF